MVCMVYLTGEVLAGICIAQDLMGAYKGKGRLPNDAIQGHHLQHAEATVLEDSTVNL